jgi:DNA repair protein RecO (recombination protein O)
VAATHASVGYIINRRPFRDNSYLVDLFTQDFGKISCIARVARHRGKITKGALEPFVQARFQWSGKGDLFNLAQLDEIGRHRLSPKDLLKGLYLNELLLKLLLSQHTDTELFFQYQQTLKHLPNDAMQMMQFELDLLESLGHGLLYDDDINVQHIYAYVPETGFVPTGHQYNGVDMSGELLFVLQHRVLQNESLQDGNIPAYLKQELRNVLDKLFNYLLAGKKLNARRMIQGY